MNTKERVAFILNLAEQGEFGTPEKQNRGSSSRGQFWRAFEGQLNPSDIKGTIGYSYAKAGLLFKRTLTTQRQGWRINGD